MFVWQNNEHSEWDLPGLQVSPYRLGDDTAKFDLTLALWESDDGIAGSLNYALALFDEPTVQRHIGYLRVMLETIARDADRPFTTVDVLSPEERTLLLETWNDTHADIQHDLCLHHVFEQQVDRTPEAIAVVYKDQSLSYTELNTCANRLAHKLVELGVKPDSLVGVCIKRSPAMIIGILAILKAGGAYVPLDPTYPSERLKMILDDAMPTITVADSTSIAALGKVAVGSLIIVDPNLPQAHRATNPQIHGLTTRHLAYVMYTSGSTGKPKGVMIEHRGVTNLTLARRESCGIQEGSRALQFTSISFDVSVWDMLVPLSSGASIFILSDAIRYSRDKTWEYMSKYSITHASFTPSFLRDGKELPVSIRPLTIVSVGEPLNLALLQNLTRQGITVINDYGPTEATVTAASWKCIAGYDGNVVPIGRPIGNIRLYLLDAYREPVPSGAVGELYIGGIGVGRGYFNRPDLTAERFVPDHFCDNEGARMYRTGDLARYLRDGSLEHLGRNDHQTKIRGFRIEIGEIEARLREHPNVSEAVVVTLGEGSNKRLVAYVTAMSGDQVAGSKDGRRSQLALTLRSHLATQLPEYMVPSAFVRMDSFPLTPNGKLDRHALPDPSDDDFAREAFDEPQGRIESAISNIWSEILNVDRVGRHDDFFVIGGHSLLAVKMISQIRHMLGFEISLRTVFEAPTVAKLAPRLGESGTTQEESFHVLLPIKSKGSRAPLFCVHPVLGLSWCFMGLSRHLPSDQPLYGLQARGFYGDTEPASTLDEMVFDYISHIRRVQPHGPYHLLGYSLGGLVAHTMAAYLEKEGERVALVALMDTPAGYHIPSEENEQDEIIPIQILRGKNEHDVPDLAKPFFKRTAKVFKNNGRLAGSQAPHVTNGNLILLRATMKVESTERLITPDEWKPYVLGEIETHDIHCAHVDMVESEPLAEIGRILTEKLEESYSYGHQKEC
ncbi:hypothetical protein BGX28_005148 [Mortierella sp. GBA30]|nr:hypothetical protein BGX28_005148 [Mortierella sp. GBA30]